MQNTKPVIKILEVLLANSYVLALKTQYAHWNITGINFISLHNLFEEQYNDLHSAVDVIAERIRALDEMTLGSFKAYLALTSLQEADAEQGEVAIVTMLRDDHKHMIKDLRGDIESLSKLNDEVTVGLLTDRLGTHEKMLWMLNSLLCS